MRCDACGQYRLYMKPIVTLRRSPELTATVEPERTPEDDPEVVGRYHAACYAAERERDPSLPPASE
jgi:hypothetical protein